jgi:hypothetical protein
MERSLDGADVASDAAHHTGCRLHLAGNSRHRTEDDVEIPGDLLEVGRNGDQPDRKAEDQDNGHGDCANSGWCHYFTPSVITR